MIKQLYRAMHMMMKTDIGFKFAIHETQFGELGKPIQDAFYYPNAISIIQEMPWVRKTTLVEKKLNPKKTKFSVRNLHGITNGKTPGSKRFDTFLDHGRALKSRSEYTLPNWIGCETEEDFRTNCDYLREKLSWIAGTKDGVPILFHREWDDKYYLSNIDGANHFAAVYRQCIEQNRDFTFECRIENHKLNKANCLKALERHSALVLLTSDAQILRGLLQAFKIDMSPYYREFHVGKSVLTLNWFIDQKPYDVYQTLKEILPPTCYFDLREYVYEIIDSSTSARHLT